VEGDCRIMFALELDPAGGEDAVALADIGSHEAVY
jgi:mRNA-degrading endonuclease YafQ of YafQ-DinJ toxin-antitoxin module